MKDISGWTTVPLMLLENSSVTGTRGASGRTISHPRSFSCMWEIASGSALCIRIHFCPRECWDEWMEAELQLQFVRAIGFLLSFDDNARLLTLSFRLRSFLVFWHRVIKKMVTWHFFSTSSAPLRWIDGSVLKKHYKQTDGEWYFT